MTIRHAFGRCSLGTLLVAWADHGLCAILLGDAPDDLTADLRRHFRGARFRGEDPALASVVSSVARLVEDPSRGLDLPLDVRGTAFQAAVWSALREIPCGSTASYAEVARRIGRPRAVRAVAQACRANPLTVVIPCHRVIGSDGSLTGFGAGLDRKKALLERESRGRGPR